MIRGLAKETPPSGHSRPPILHTAYRAERERMESRDQVLAVESGRPTAAAHACIHVSVRAVGSRHLQPRMLAQIRRKSRKHS
jgi:hypothetical protein